VGIPREYRIDGAPARSTALWSKGAEWLKAQGAQIVEVSLPTPKYALPTYYNRGARGSLFQPGALRWGQVRYRAPAPATSPILYEEAGAKDSVRKCSAASCRHLRAVGGYYDAYYSRAQKLRSLIKRDFGTGFRVVRRAADPTTPGRPLVWAPRPAIPRDVICRTSSP